MLALFSNVLLWLFLLACCYPVFCLIVFLACLVVDTVRTLFNYFAIQYVNHHVNEIVKVNLYPSYQTYKRMDVPAGYSDGWRYRRWYYRYRYIPKGKMRKAKVHFENKYVLTVIFKEESQVYQQIMMRGVISQK